jgi:hypothetical protein
LLLQFELEIRDKDIKLTELLENQIVVRKPKQIVQFK